MTDLQPLTPQRANEIYTGNTARFYQEYMLPKLDKNGDQILESEEFESFFSELSEDNNGFLKKNNLEDEFTLYTIQDSIQNLYQEEKEIYMKKDNFEVNTDEESELDKVVKEVDAAISFYSSKFPNLEKYFSEIDTFYFSNGNQAEDLTNSNAPTSLQNAVMQPYGAAGAYSISENQILILTEFEQFKGADSEYNQYFKYGENAEVNDSLGLRTTLAHEFAHSLDFATINENGDVVFDPEKKDVNYGGFSNSPAFTEVFEQECRALGIDNMSYGQILNLKSEFVGGHARQNIAYSVADGNDEAFACMVETILNSDYKFSETVYKNFPETLKVVTQFLESIE